MRSLFCLFSVVLVQVSYTSAADWKAGVADINITPEKPVLMAGYASRTKPFERVEQELSAKALALDDGHGNRAVLITMDLIGLSAAIAEPICAKLKETTGLNRDQILLSWAHNHAGPSLSLKADVKPGSSGADAQNTVEYTRSLQQKLVLVAANALTNLQSAKLSWGSGIAHFPMNRREFATNGVILGVNPRGPVDRSVPVLRIDSIDGALRGVVFGCACHNTTLTQTNYSIAGDYAGYAQRYVEARSPGARAMSMLGCGGDANPYPRNTMELAERHGNDLGQEVCRVLDTTLRPVNGPLKTVFGHAALPLQSPPRQELEKLAASGRSWQTGGARQMLAVLDRGEKLPESYRSPVAVWQFGQDLTLVALSGEVLVDYVTLIENAVGPLKLWIAAYCNESFGYVPSARVLREGGYETLGLYVSGGWFTPEVDKALVDKVRELALQAGRVMP